VAFLDLHGLFLRDVFSLGVGAEEAEDVRLRGLGEAEGGEGKSQEKAH
jgi:hypothetical protein